MHQHGPSENKTTFLLTNEISRFLSNLWYAYETMTEMIIIKYVS